jgi:16S rRNA (guanine527-N7)-methyltransferase
VKQPAHTTDRPTPIVSRETKERLDAFVDLLLKWNRTINLISRKDESEIWPRHVQDALQLTRFLPDTPEPMIDLGTGAGFPGLVLAIATQRHVDLIESDHRKSAFLHEAVRVTNASAAIHTARIETLALPKVRVVTARALAPLDQLIGMAQNFLMEDGFLLAPKGSNASTELSAARAHWHMTVQSEPSMTSADATIFKISEVRRVGSDI